jgi:two-component system, cell cycle sensor histidine kinase and response regulator CckA
VRQAGRGNHAIGLAEQFKGPIALIVSDVALPDMSGPSVATKVRALDPEAKVLHVSGYAEVTVAQQLIAEGAILLQKPLSRGDLLSKVDEMLHLRTSLASP